MNGTSQKDLPTLISDMVRDPAFAKSVLADPASYAVEYNLTPRNVEALKAASYDDLVSIQAPGHVQAAGGCYYGG